MTRSKMRMATGLLIFAATTVAGCRGELPTAPKQSAAASVTTMNARRRVVPPGVRQVPPPCSAPAPFYEVSEPAAGYLVRYKDGVDSRATTARLAAKFEFIPIAVYTAALSGFWGYMSLQTVAALRCEPEVADIWENAKGHIAG